ncbi:MAG: AAA family ATPase [Micromonosporaceae bacterium]|nr:AAA family ATPase [Micromonosporaceae bacterium]
MAYDAVSDFQGASGADPLHGLDPEQLRAVTAPAGPVCILAGAGTGKTRAITRRIAHRVRSGEVRAQHVLAVTFTARAASELRDRLRRLGVGGVSARTFHVAALRQLRYFAPRLLGGKPLPEVLDSKARLVTVAASRAGVKADRAQVRDLAAEIEWAKANLTNPDEYAVAAAKAMREPPCDPEDAARVFAAYEKVKRSSGWMDFEDLLRAGVWAIEEHPDVADQVRAQYRCFVVDEYQDVNPLQQRLLEAWLGGRDDLTVVGDASQTIYSFAGASADYLVDFPRRHEGCVLVRLTRDYRSTPQVVGLANAVIRTARGSHSRLRLTLAGQREPGPEPEIRSYDDEPAEAAAVASRCAELIAAGAPAWEIAILFRTNAQSETYEEALADAGVPYVVRGGQRFFERPEVRQAMSAIRVASRTADLAMALPDAVGEALKATGWQPGQPPPGGAARERWEALAALVRLAEDWAVATSARRQAGAPSSGDAVPPDGPPESDALESEPPLSLGEFHDELSRRAAAQHAPAVEGVTLASLHAAKGLEWDAVFLVGLVDGTVPITHARSPEQVEEERRLLYVGITRARELLWLTWAAARSPGGRPRRPSRFLPRDTHVEATPAGPRPKRRKPSVVRCRVCGATLLDGAERKLGRCQDCPSTMDEELFERLRNWRIKVAEAKQTPAYTVFTDATLTALAERRPTTAAELVEIRGIGPHKLAQYGEPVLALMSGADPDDLPVPS